MAKDAKAQELIVKAKLYRLFAFVFALTGLVIFGVMFKQQTDGSVFSALTNPFIIVMVLFPFMPAVFLSLRAKKLETLAAAKSRK